MGLGLNEKVLPGQTQTSDEFPRPVGNSIYDWHKCSSSRKLILFNPQPIASFYLVADLTTLSVSKVHLVKLEVCLRCEMHQQDLDTFELIPVE